MPKKPEPAPGGNLSADAFTQLMDTAGRDAMADLVQAANRRYLYWDDFKYRAMPAG